MEVPFPFHSGDEKLYRSSVSLCN